jgi:hypothetical protein
MCSTSAWASVLTSCGSGSAPLTGEYPLLLVAPCGSCSASLTGEYSLLPASERPRSRIGVSGANPLPLWPLYWGCIVPVRQSPSRTSALAPWYALARRILGLALALSCGKSRRHPLPCVVYSQVRDPCRGLCPGPASVALIPKARAEVRGGSGVVPGAVPGLGPPYRRPVIGWEVILLMLGGTLDSSPSFCSWRIAGGSR